MSKLCRICKEVKPLSGFFRDSSRTDGYNNKCKPCSLRNRKPRNPEVGKYDKLKRIRYNYGLNPTEYDALFKKQGGRCAICGRFQLVSSFGVDHCHDTGKVRGLLCTMCNTGLVMFRDEPEFLQAAIEYLISSR